ncbi:hypothetical protein [Methylobacterium sp. AMS5]|uniref:hypothetical protein n=1 Tax=Methylobacterium sp. AMS5 TaxID=925818 RepID=UPI00074F9369|nr:hypothetical protein [Methylobacterium sp. AMS5]AMB45055.1 hypothetical protein Y590_09115 [Methylobacterium sp. AMS5]
MRPALALAAILAAGPAPAGPRPAPGWYCPVGSGLPIAIDVPRRGSAGIYGMECHAVSYRHGKIRGARCFGNHNADMGSPYETDLFVREDGSIAHDGQTFRRQEGGRLCP